MKIKAFAIIFFTVWSSALLGQTIEFNFPKFANKIYDFYVVQGNQNDTIAQGALDNLGKTTIVVPEQYRSYIGMATWWLRDGGGLNHLIINNEDFDITCLEAAPSSSTITYKNSPENEFLNLQAQYQHKLLQRMEAIKMAKNLYDETNNLYPILEKEEVLLDQEFENSQLEIAKSLLYAARVHEINNFLMGVGRKSYSTQEERDVDMNNYVIDNLNLSDLYTTNNWNYLIEGWVDLQINVLNNDSAFFLGAKKILDRTEDKVIYTAFAEKIIKECSRHGRDYILPPLAEVFKQSGKLNRPSLFLERITRAQVGDRAPLLGGHDKELTGKTTLVVFYDSECDNCVTEMNSLIKNYSELKEKGVRLITIAGDNDKVKFNENSKDYPWTDILCDFKGFAGKNFLNYGILGTPTFILVDEEGIVRGRYARLDDFLKD